MIEFILSLHKSEGFWSSARLLSLLGSAETWKKTMSFSDKFLQVPHMTLLVKCIILKDRAHEAHGLYESSPEWKFRVSYSVILWTDVDRMDTNTSRNPRKKVLNPTIYAVIWGCWITAFTLKTCWTNCPLGQFLYLDDQTSALQQNSWNMKHSVFDKAS